MPNLKSLVKDLTYYSGILPIYHRFKNKKSLTVVLFHRVIDKNDPRWLQCDREWSVSTDFFNQCLSFFKNHYSIITIKDIEEHFTSGKALPSYPLLITFDDGWADNFEYAAPICKKYNSSFHTFVTTGVSGKSYLNWRETVQGLLTAGHFSIEELIDNINTECKLSISIDYNTRQLIDYIISLEDDKKSTIISHINSLASNFKPQQQMLSIEQLRQMWHEKFYLGTHGHTHEPITECKDQEKELVTSKSTLTKNLQPELMNSEINSMAFPHSAVDHATYKKTVDAGYKFIFGGRKQLNTLEKSGDSCLYFGRINIDQTSLQTHGKLSKSLLSLLLFRQVAKKPSY